MKKLLLLCSTAVAFVPTAAFAQSTGTIATEEEAIVVTGTRNQNVDGVQVPDTTKAQAVITQELISKQNPGQTILNTINLIPGVNFTQNDAFGSSGGNIRIRGFDGNRISLTFDGLPLNDTGNYAIYSNQQLDPELIEQVNVNLGVTDVDSPTASAAGGTINYRTILPTRDFSVRGTGSIGSFDFRRVFGIIHTGDLTSSGLRGFVSGSVAKNDKFKGPGEIYKRQFNARLYQPVGNNGDFISVSGHVNINRNNFYRNPSVNDLRTLLGASAVPATNLATSQNPLLIGDYNEQQFGLIDGFENNTDCDRIVSGNDILSDPVCSSYYNIRVNPSDTGNIRINSRFTLSDNLILTVDPSYQYVLAHGGGITRLAENSARAKGAFTTSPGVDFNGDGNFGFTNAAGVFVPDTVNFYTPNITNTHRFGLTSSLIWDISREHRVRVAYTFDRGRHRQTGEWGFMQADGDPQNIFSGRNGFPVLDASGYQIQQRNRLSIASLNQIAGQYIGRFFDRALRVEVGVRRPFFKRELETFCPIEARGSGFAYCTSETNLLFINPTAPVPTSGPTPYYRPFKADYSFGKLLPNVGFTYNFRDSLAGLSVFGSWAKGFSAPRTDNLYRAPVVTLDPEETDAFDLGARFTRRNLQAQVAAWQINYKNRIVSSFNQELGISLDRNVGRVDSRGFDANIAYQPLRFLSVIGLVSYIDTELKSNIELGTFTAPATGPVVPPAGFIVCNGVLPANGQPAVLCADTKGKQVTETPKWQFGGRVNLDFNPVELGFQFKRVGSRFATDVNDIKVKGYTTADADLRFALETIGLKDSYFQLNVTNLFDEQYFGNISTQIRAADNPNFTLSAPRTIIASVNVGF